MKTNPKNKSSDIKKVEISATDRENKQNAIKFYWLAKAL